MKITKKLKNDYKAYLGSYLPPSILQNDKFENGLNVILDELSELSREDICTARKKRLDLQCEASDLAERTLRLNDGSEIIAGARFKNLDTSFPFIEIHKTTEATAEYLAELKELLRYEFKGICPRGFKFKDKPQLHIDAEKWSHTVFGEIRRKLDKNIIPGINLGFESSLDWHAQYVSEYKERLNEKTELNGFVRIGQKDEFKEAVQNKSLLLITDTSGFSGVIAGINSPLYGLPAIYMIESFLSKRWVGKKIAPLAHSFFLNGIAERYKYVWGTIYEQNHSSLNTALRTGRNIIETEYFIPMV